MSKATVQAGQNLTDIAIQYCGNQQAVFEVASLNNLSVTDDLAAGVEVLIPDAYDKRVVKYFLDGQYFPATSEELGLEGIDYWGIEINFEVQ